MTEAPGVPLTEFILLAAVFLTVVMIILGLFGLLAQEPAVRRLTNISSDTGGSSSATSIFYGQNQSKLMNLLRPLQNAIMRGEEERSFGLMRRRLIQAGFYNPNTVRTYFLIRIMLALLFAGVVAPAAYFLLLPAPSSFLLIGIAVGAVLGYFGPSLALSVKIKDRREQFKLGMPDAMDMILVGVESGMSLPAALQQVCEELADAHPVICEQFQIVGLEFQAGKQRGEALQAMARRVDVDVARTFASMIAQSEALGTSLAQTLRVIADEMRKDRLLKAERRASELPVKMAFPLVLLIFPALFMTIMSPALIRMVEAFGNAF